MKVMNLPWDDKLLVLLAFFIPGFIIREVYGLFVGIEKSDAQKLLPTLVGFGALHYGFTAWPLFLLPTGTAREVYLYVDVLLLPVAWAPIALLVRDNDRWKPVFFSKRGLKLIGPQPRGIIEGFDGDGLILRLPNPQEIIKALLSPEAGPWEKVLTDKARWIRIRLKSGRLLEDTTDEAPLHQRFRVSGKFIYRTCMSSTKRVSSDHRLHGQAFLFKVKK